MLKELFEKNKDIVINTDIDGFLCGMILQKYYGCRVVGFSDSKKKVWTIPQILDIDSPIFLDIYVARPNVVCIDQHIIAINNVHHNLICSYGTKINPNLERTRTFDGDMEGNYYTKYPFGTIHYLISLMGREGIQIDLPDLYKEYNTSSVINPNEYLSICAGHIILRADDALYSTLRKYIQNTSDWWPWLDPDNNFIAIQSLREFISSCNRRMAEDYESKVEKFFVGIGCDGKDGAFYDIVDNNGTILPKVLHYRDVISAIMNMPLNIPDTYVCHTGEFRKQYCKTYNEMTMLNDDNLYSYAIIGSPTPKYSNFSYTINMH